MWLNINSVLSVLISEGRPKAFCLLLSENGKTEEVAAKRVAQHALEQMGFLHYACRDFEFRSSENTGHFHADVVRTITP
jgi:hypothetical protein